jgi:archaellum component FlaC
MEEEEKKYKIDPEVFNNIKEFTPEIEDALKEFLDDVVKTTDEILKEIEAIKPEDKDNGEGQPDHKKSSAG